MKNLLPIISVFLLLSSQTAWATTRHDKTTLLIKAGKAQLIEPCAANQKLEAANITLFQSEIRVNAKCEETGQKAFEEYSPYVRRVEPNWVSHNNEILTMINSGTTIYMTGRQTRTVIDQTKEQLNLMINREDGSPCLKIQLNGPRKIFDIPEVWVDQNCQAVSVQIENRILIFPAQIFSEFQIHGIMITTTPMSNDKSATASDREETHPIQQANFKKTRIINTSGAVKIFSPCGKNVDPLAAQILFTQSRVLLNFACLTEGESHLNKYGFVPNTFVETDYLRIMNDPSGMPYDNPLSWQWQDTKKQFSRLYTLRDSSGKTCNQVLVSSANQDPFVPGLRSSNRVWAAPLGFAFDQDCLLLAIFALDLVAIMPASASEDFWISGVRIQTGGFAVPPENERRGSHAKR